MANREELYYQILHAYGLRPVMTGPTGMPRTYLAEMWSPDAELQSKWERLGYMSIIPLARTGLARDDEGRPLLLYGGDADRPYGVAIAAVEAAVEVGDLRSDDLSRGLHHLQAGTFETSDLAEYLPGQNEE